MVCLPYIVSISFVRIYFSVDIFYMKTCSFRGADPSRFNIIGLFCDQDEPEVRYTMVPCGDLFCPCCHPGNQLWLVVDFVSSGMDQFVNGYTTYLSCPAVSVSISIM